MDRSQLVWRAVDVENLLEQDHPARAIWALSADLDLEPFGQGIAAVEGVAGPHALGPAALAQPVALRLQPGGHFGAGNRAAVRP